MAIPSIVIISYIISQTVEEWRYPWWVRFLGFFIGKKRARRFYNDMIEEEMARISK